MKSRLLQQLLHNKTEGVILLTISDSIGAETMKRICNLLLDEEIKKEDERVKENNQQVEAIVE